MRDEDLVNRKISTINRESSGRQKRVVEEVGAGTVTSHDEHGAPAAFVIHPLSPSRSPALDRNLNCPGRGGRHREDCFVRAI